MSNTLKTSLIVIGVLVAGAALILVGMSISRFKWASPWGWHGFASSEFNSETSEIIPYGGMMGSHRTMGGADMMGGYWIMGGMDMMGGFSNTRLLGVAPISLADAEAAVEDYLDAIQNNNLEIGEIMIFDNHAYAQIVEVDTGIGALEVLVDPVTFAVSPEPGPNMMWNSKYSPMTGFGGFGMMGMMGTFGNQSSESMGGMMGESTERDVTSELPLPADQAVEVAQRYLDAYLPGTKADDHADPFYGYYTLHILRDGETVGMLSVNGYTRQVFLHSWHGKLIEVGGHE